MAVIFNLFLAFWLFLIESMSFFFHSKCKCVIQIRMLGHEDRNEIYLFIHRNYCHQFCPISHTHANDVINLTKKVKLQFVFSGKPFRLLCAGEGNSKLHHCMNSSEWDFQPVKLVWNVLNEKGCARFIIWMCGLRRSAKSYFGMEQLVLNFQKSWSELLVVSIEIINYARNLGCVHFGDQSPLLEPLERFIIAPECANYIWKLFASTKWWAAIVVLTNLLSCWIYLLSHPLL